MRLWRRLRRETTLSRSRKDPRSRSRDFGSFPDQLPNDNSELATARIRCLEVGNWDWERIGSWELGIDSYPPTENVTVHGLNGAPSNPLMPSSNSTRTVRNG